MASIVAYRELNDATKDLVGVIVINRPRIITIDREITHLKPGDAVVLKLDGTLYTISDEAFADLFPAPSVTRASKATNNTLLTITAVADDGDTLAVSGSANLVVTVGTDADTMKITYNGGTPVDNVAASTVGVVVDGGEAGSLTLTAGALPTFPATDAVMVVGDQNAINVATVTLPNDETGTLAEKLEFHW